MRCQPIERFNKKIRITPSCWIWVGAKRKKYGNFSVGGENISAHRFSYEFHIGKIPDDFFVCHKCDNPSCVNPDHLFIGTAAENTADMINKGRQKIFPLPPLTKIPQEIIEKVFVLRRLGLSYAKIADELGMTRSHAFNVAKGYKRINKVCESGRAAQEQ